MKLLTKQYFILSILFASLLSAQTYVDPNLNIDAKVLAFELTQTPTIDGIGDEWSNIPWTELYYSDRDFNEDGLPDPIPNRNDYQAKFKAGWISGSNVFYMLIDIKDDDFLTADSINWYNVDGMEIRIDPFDTEAAGEPSSEGSAFNIAFKIGDNTASGLEGPGAEYQAVWTVDETTFPKHALLETAIILPSAVQLQSNYVMGFMLYCNDIDKNQDDSPKSKDAVLNPWSQRFYNANEKISVDGTWENIYYWGNIECNPLNIVTFEQGSGSLQDVLDNAAQGTIIKLGPGVYSENLTVSNPYVQIIGTMTDTDTTMFVPADKNLPVMKIIDNDLANGIVIKNVAFNGWSDAGDGTMAAASTGIQVGSAQSFILGNYFTGFESPILESGLDSTIAYSCVYEDNHLYKCKGGIKANSPNSIFRYNLVEEAQSGYGLDIKGLISNNAIDIGYNTVFNHHGECGIGNGGSGVFTIHDNYLVRSEQLYGAGDTSGDDGIENQDEGGSTDYIYNNTIVGWKSDGMQLGGSSAGTTNFHILNNLISHCAGKDYDIRKTGSYDINYGLSYLNGGGDLIATLGANFSTADPLFTAEFEDDFTITSNSPAVDAGMNDPFGFKQMYFGEGVDIGAYETGSPLVGVKEQNTNVPNEIALYQNYPNPFNPTTKINFSLPKSGNVKLNVYNVLGQQIMNLIDGNYAKGIYEVNFNASNLSSGMYFYTLEVGNTNITKKMMLIK
ncbi:MAG: T9SS type A sorting domain-containing protein [Ignavibacteriae bacterium]|nr:T9SS type A sorting domain-containing protein [Ignavibacteriota bacterium]